MYCQYNYADNVTGRGEFMKLYNCHADFCCFKHVKPCADCSFVH